ncbi:Gfo/Idh/MocA family protein [Kribbella sp. NPDC004536]|uniref:Gfo/Idh/MocA family protein n=1 Tax=Kribbella sp. NPDC004536 TaxID=3364106 RepID=UPI0036C5631C
MTELRVALVGMDHWYSALPIAEGAHARDRFSLAGVWDSDPARAAYVSERYGGQVEADWRTLVEDPRIDAVLSFVSPDLNPEVCVAAAKAGKHIIANKPMALRLEDASRVVEAVRAAGVTFLPAESRQRLGPGPQQLRQWLNDGRIGRLISASMTTWAGLPRQWPDDPSPGWFADPARTVGGGWVDHSIYQLDLLRWLLGEEVVAISGQTAKHLRPDLEVEDYGVATATFSGGAVATLEDTWTAPDGGFQASYTIVGSTGAVRLDGVQGRLLMIDGNGPVELDPPGKHDQAADLDHWAAVIAGESVPVATVEDAWHNLAACLAFYESVDAGRTLSPQEGPA